MQNQNRRLVFGILLSLFVFNILAWSAVLDIGRSRVLEVNFFDVGQGDAVFIETPEKQQILIDGGPDSTVLEKLGKEMPSWDKTIDLVILTHPEKDHMQGLLDVLKRYKIKNILWTGVVRDTAEFQEWEKLLKEKEIKEGTKITIAKAGQIICLASCSESYEKQMRLDVLFPFDDLSSQTFKDSNDTSIILHLVYKNNTFLFTGDATRSVEKKLLERGISINSDVLKVGHHGSKTSSSDNFVAAVSPAIAVIPVGKDNQYGHPHKEVLDTLKKYGISILQTDINSDIKIFSDGENLRINQ
ncbi:MAG: ComEC/Rec2 family competence protein [bacterium]|nr:ComEC/Rec2 family competence protein [bacterium]